MYSYFRVGSKNGFKKFKNNFSRLFHPDRRMNLKSKPPFYPDDVTADEWMKAINNLSDNLHETGQFRMENTELQDLIKKYEQMKPTIEEAKKQYHDDLSNNLSTNSPTNSPPNNVQDDLAEYSLFLGVEVNYKNFRVAIENGDTDKVKGFMERGYKPSIFDWNVAVARNQLEIAKLFFEEGIMPDPWFRNHLLIYANQNPDMITLLAKAGIFPDEKQFGWAKEQKPQNPEVIKRFYVILTLIWLGIFLSHQVLQSFFNQSHQSF